jgi:glycosyltransferase involved in cell wall biosynthesis
MPFKPKRLYKTYRLFNLLHKKINQLNPKVFWEPSHIMPPGISNKIKKILTIHDLSSITLPQFHTKMNVLGHKLLLKYSINQADTILTVSNTIKDEIIERYKPKAKVISVYNGINKNPKIANNIPFPINPYFVYVGTIEPRKNLETLITAFLQVKDKIPQKLYIIGDYGWKSEKIHQLIDQNSDCIKYLGFLEESEKNYYLKNATALIYPSIYEGFGLPPIESMQLGTPVITTTGGSLKELYSQHSLQFDPYDIEKLTKNMLEISQDQNLRSKLASEGIEYAKKFNWEFTAKQIDQIINELTN